MKEALERLYNAFRSAGMRYAYNRYPADENAPKMPYVSAMVVGGSAVPADDEMYYKTSDIEVLLFSNWKNIEAELNVMNVLESQEIQYTWKEQYNEDAKCYMITYKFKVRV